MKKHYLLPKQGFRSLDQYWNTKGKALECAQSMSSEDIINEVKASDLKGRGGAAFPTGVKWHTLYRDNSPKKYVVINAAEGEPGTFKDRMIIRKNPYAMIEGALIAAKVLKANEIYIGIKKSFQLEITSLNRALKEFEEAGFLKHVKFHIVAGPEDYLFGEEKALLNVIEGIGPFPREPHLPPYEVGLFSNATSSNPCLINNVETLARVPEILLHGAESFRSLGTEDTPGPIICTVSGDVKRPGIYEVEAGMTLDELLNEFAHGPSRRNGFKAILSGVSNPVMTEEHLNARLEFKELSDRGSGLGSAGFMVYDSARSIPRLTQEVAKFLYRESCNQCTPCKTGLGTSSICLDGLFVDNRDESLIEKAVLAALSAPNSNRCYLPVQGSLIIPSLIRTFEQEFKETHELQHFLVRETLPIITDYDEVNHEFTCKDDPSQVDRPYSQDWDHTRTTFIDRGAF